MRQGLHVDYGTHISDEAQGWAKRSNVRLYFTPTNASWLNRIECHLGPLRKFALNNSDYRTCEEQEAAGAAFDGVTGNEASGCNRCPKRETVLRETAYACSKVDRTQPAERWGLPASLGRFSAHAARFATCGSPRRASLVGCSRLRGCDRAGDLAFLAGKVA